MEPSGVVPVDPAADLPLDGTPVGQGGAAVVDGLGLEQSNSRLAKDILERVADGAGNPLEP